MKKLYLIAIIVSLFSLSLFSLSQADKEIIKTNTSFKDTFSQEGINDVENKKKEKNYVENEIIVKYKKDQPNLNTRNLSVNNFNSTEKEKGIVKKEEYKNFDFSLYEIRDGKTVEDKIEELKKDPNVLYAEPNYKRELFDIGTDDEHGNLLWGLHNTGQNVNGISGTNDADIDWPGARELRSITSTSSVIVAVIDTGVAYNHPDLQNKMWDGSECVDETGTTISGGCLHGYDYENNNNDPSPNYHTHGTHVAGTIAASINNNIGIAGVASNTKIMALEFNLTVASEIKAIDFAIENGAKIINASYGGEYFSQFEKDAIARFRDAGGLFIAAAGNDSLNNDLSNAYPANYDLENIITVAATDQYDNLAGYSNYGQTSVDIAAPGSNILSTIADTVVYNEDFSSSTTPNIPVNYSQTPDGNWRTASSTYDNNSIALFSDTSYPYTTNSETTIKSEVINLSGKESASISLFTGCDTEYSSTEYLDYITLEVTSNSLGSTTQITKWDEYTIDGNKPDSAGWAHATLNNYLIPEEFLVNDLQIQFRWTTNSDNNNYGGCFVDNIELETIGDGSTGYYGYMNGTSMATPHVAGLAALIWEYEDSLSSDKVKEIIINSGDSLTDLEGEIISGKRINAYSALSSIDLTNPTVELRLSNNNKDLKEGDELLITANFNEAIDSSSNVEVILTGSNEATSTMERASSTTYTYTHIVSSGNGTSTITLSGAKDLFGNELQEQPTENNKFLVDNVAPEKPIIEIIPERINYTSSSSVDISGSAATGTSLYIELENNGNLATSSLNLDISSSTFTFNFDLSSSSDNYLEDGEIVVSLSSSDEAGNTSFATTTILKDTVVPIINSVETMDINNNGRVDNLKLIFNKDILDSSASSSDFIYTNYAINKISTTSLDISNDNILYLELTEKESYDSATSTLVYTKGTLSDDFDNYLKDTEINSIDKTIPLVEPLGDSESDYEITATSSVDIIFSEELASSSKRLIEEQILKGSSSNTISFTWDSNSLSIYSEEGTFFENDVVVDIEDLNGNTNKELVLIDSSLEDYQAITDSQNQITLNASTTEAVIDYLYNNVEIIVDENFASSSINLSSLIYNQSGLLPGITILSNNILNIETKISSSTTITASSTSWDEKISPASSTDFTLPDRDGYNRSLDTAIKMGSDNEDLFFDKAVRILFPGKANKKIAYSNQGTSFSEITSTCSSDDIDEVTTPCKTDVGSDLVVWTSHFSTFVLYSESEIEEESSSSGGSSSGGGYTRPSTENEEEEIIEEEPAYTVSTSTEDVVEDIDEDVNENVEEDQKTEKENTTNLFTQFVEQEKRLLSNIDLNLSKRLSGRILLQVEENGEAWYVNPLNTKKYYLGRPLDAFNIMRALGLGISNKDFESFHGYAPKRLSGRILLKVQDYGRAYYVDPLTLKMHYLGRPDDAFSLMREMGLGITNENVRKIDIETIELQ